MKPTPKMATYVAGNVLSAPNASMAPSMVAPSIFTAKVPNGKKDFARLWTPLSSRYLLAAPNPPKTPTINVIVIGF